jgi:hypothetical protein
VSLTHIELMDRAGIASNSFLLANAFEGSNFQRLITISELTL